MKSKAILMALAMMTTALAGCTSGTDGVPEVDEDALNELIQDNLQDFINNTTVVVNQEIHYHNNTTVVNNDYDSTNQYNNTTNIDGGEVNNHETDNSVNNYNGSGAGSASTMQMFTVSWDIVDYIGYDPSEKIVSGGGDSSLLYVDFYNGQTVEFRDLTCEDWLNYQSYSEYSWRTYLQNIYGTNWDDLYDTAEDIYDHFQTNANGGYYVSGQCNSYSWTYLGSSYWNSSSRIILFEIDLEVGQAMSFLVREDDVVVDLNCDDGYGTGIGNGSYGTYDTYIGGQANCTVTGSTVPVWKLSSNGYQYDDDGNLTAPHGTQHYEYQAITDSDSADSSFAVYFTLHEVEVYDLGTE